jgi:hypothetical protein
MAPVWYDAPVCPTNLRSPMCSLPAVHRSANTTLPALCIAILDAAAIGLPFSPMYSVAVQVRLARLIDRDHISWPASES